METKINSDPDGKDDTSRRTSSLSEQLESLEARVRELEQENEELREDASEILRGTATADMLWRCAERLGVLYKTNKAILSASSAEEIAENALPYLRQLLPGVRASVTLFDPDEDESILLADTADDEKRSRRGQRSPLRTPELIEKLTQGEIDEVQEIQALASPSPFLQTLQAEGMRSCVRLPLIVQGELIGSLNVSSKEPLSLSTADLNSVRIIARQLSKGLQVARLFQDMQQYTGTLEQRVTRRTAALHVSEARFRAVFEGSAIGIALVDLEGRLVESNPALRTMLGYEEAELRGQMFADFFPVSADGAGIGQCRELLEGTHRHARMETSYTCKDGKSRFANLAFSLIPGTRGGTAFCVCMMEDVTERKQTQEALIQAEKLAITGKMAASLAHEINNPLQTVIGSLGLVKETLEEREESIDFVELALRELRRAARVVAELRDIHHPTKQGTGRKRATDVNEILEQTLALNSRRCQEQEVRVIRALSPQLPLIEAAPDRVQQVCLNLILNAIEAMPGGGELHVSTAHVEDPTGIQIVVGDTGAGIPQRNLPHLFDPFFTTKQDGVGLGLFIIQNIVEDHDGHVEVESELGRGTTFTVWLPT